MGGDSYDQHYAQLLYDLERISVNEEDLNRRLALLQENPQIDDSVLFAPAPVAQIPQPQSVPVPPLVPQPISVSTLKSCSICSRTTDVEWVELPNCVGREHVFCVSCAERSVVRNNSLRVLNCSVCHASKPLFRDGITEVLHNIRDADQGRISFENEPICVKCQSGYHSGHNIETLDTTFTNAKKEIEELDKEVQDTRREAGANIEKALEAQGKVYRDAQSRRDQLRAEFTALREELDRKEREFLQTIDTIERKRCEKIEEKIVNLTCSVDACDDAMVLIEQAKSTLDRSNAMDFVQFVADKKEKILEVVELDENLQISVQSLQRAFPNLPTYQAKQAIQRMIYRDNAY